MRLQFSCLWTLLKMRLAHMMVFRLSFFGACFVDGSLCAVQILLFSAIFGQVDAVGGWTRSEMLVFIGTFSLINALNMVLFFFGLNGIPNKIKNGELDLYLTRPMNPLLRLSFEQVNPGSLPLVAFSVGIIAYGAAGLPGPIVPGRAALYALYVLLMTLLWYDVMLALRTVPLFVTSAVNVARAEELLELNMKLPGTLYRGIWRFVFYFLLPYGLMSTVPTQALTGALSPGMALYAAGFVACFTAFTLWFWRFGLRRYQSPGS